jgi:superfamily II DNA or RNA helicase
LESSTLTSEERRLTETELDSTREALESNGWNSMEIVYSYLKNHPNRRTWTQTYTGKGYTNAQFLVSGLMTPDSPLKSILLYHGVGVGKTCAAIAAASDYKEENSIIVLTPSQTLVKNWKEEFIGKNHCGRHIWNIPDETWKQMTIRKRLNVLHSHT